MGEKSKAFLRDVTNYIQSKEAKRYVHAELEYHVKTATKDWEKQGFDLQEAEKRAIEQMGSPIQLGQKLNKLHKPLIDWSLLLLIIVVIGISFLPTLSIWQHDVEHLSYFIWNKLFIGIIGIVVVVATMFFDYRKLEKYRWIFYGAATILLTLLIINEFPTFNGEPRIIIGPFAITSLLAIPLLFLAWAAFLNNQSFKIWQLALLFLVPLLLFLQIGNPTEALLYVAMGVMMIWSCKKLNVKQALALTLTPIIIGICVFSYTINVHQSHAWVAFLQPKLYATEGGYFYLYLQELIASAVWFGRSESAASFFDVHAAQTDFVFVHFIVEFGYFFAVLLLIILSIVAIRIIVIAMEIRNPFGNLLLVGGATLYIMQFLYNIAMLFGLVPITSISLPFLSYGLMPTLLNAFIFGIGLSVYRRKSFSQIHINGAKK